MSIDADRILKELIMIAEQAWVDVDWLEGRLAMLMGTGDPDIKVQCARLLRDDIWKKLPAKFFDDEEKQKQIIAAFDTMIYKLSEPE